MGSTAMLSGNSDRLGHAGNGNWIATVGERHDSGLGIPSKSLRGQLDFRVERVLPLHRLAAVGRHATHDGCQRTIRAVFRLVVGMIIADGGPHVGVLDLVRQLTAPVAIVTPLVRARLDLAHAPVGNVEGPFSADRVLRDRIPVARHLPALAEHARAVGIFIFNGVMVEDLPVLLIGPNLAAAHAPALHGVVLLDPVSDVEIVDVLLDDVIAAEPDVVVPVPKLVLHFAFALLAGPARIPGSGAVPVNAHCNDVANFAVVNPLHRLEIHRLMMPLQADADLQILRFGDFVCSEDAADSWAVNGHGLLHEDVLAGVDRRLEMKRPESGRRGKNHQVDTAVEDFLVRVKAAELMRLIDGDASRLGPKGLLQTPETRLQTVVKNFADGHEPRRRIGPQAIADRAATAPAGTDKSHTNRVVALGESTWRERNAAQQPRADGSGCRLLHEFTARRAFILRQLHGDDLSGRTVGIRLSWRAAGVSPPVLRLGQAGVNKNRLTSCAAPLRQSLFYQILRRRFQVQTIAFRLIGQAERPNDAKTDESGVGEVPDALRDLRILNLPIGNRELTGRAAGLG